MNFEAAFKVADTAVFAKTGRHLNDAETVVLQGSCRDQSYDELAKESNYSAKYLKQDIGPKFWKLLSEALGEEVSKTNFRSALERWAQSFAEAESPLIEVLPVPETVNSPVALLATDSSFVGRERAIVDLDHLVSQGARVIVIQGEGGIGKTTLARKYLQSQDFDLCLELWMATEARNITPVESVVEEWLKRDFNEDPGREFGVNLERLRRKLQTQRVGVLIDNLEPSLDRNGKFIESQRPYVELLRVLADSALQSITLITSRERLCESGVTVQFYVLEGLDEAAWQKCFQSRGIQASAEVLQKMCSAYAGNAKAMQILSGVIQTDFEGEVEAYWQENGNDLLYARELEDLVVSQFNRLQQLDPDAYQLLCRLGCYRYQDVPFVSIDGLLRLLWDVPEQQGRRIIRSLQDRSLIEARKGKYWLHPVIQAEARHRLRCSEEWELINRKAAAFWTESVQMVATIEDAMRAFEAYYHYVEIGDYEQASDVILNKRDTRLAGADRLGRSFYKLGLLQQMISAITLLLGYVSSGYHLSGLYSILGVLYRLTGNIHQAIECHEESARIATRYLETQGDYIDRVRANLVSWQAGALLNIGLCRLDLGELEAALELFERSQALSEKAGYARPSTGFYFAFLKSCLGFRQEAFFFAEKMYAELKTKAAQRWITEYRLVFLGQTYRNLGEVEKALEIYQEAILYAETTHHTQVKAKALNGIAELYREQADFEQSIANHLEAIRLLDQVGAKCDLAEAYYQLGLTYHKMGKPEQSQTNLQQAKHLFAKIKAAQQVQKVEQALLAS